MTISLETPPRAWGRLEAEAVAVTTGRKHPHERGEDRSLMFTPPLVLETPPRAWGRLHGKGKPPASGRNTPTSVGKTRCPCDGRQPEWKHPHERGEDPCGGPARNAGQETPPRAWGRRSRRKLWASPNRNTPTSVGKTLDFTGVDGGLVEIRFVALSVFQSQGACLKFQ